MARTRTLSWKLPNSCEFPTFARDFQSRISRDRGRFYLANRAQLRTENTSRRGRLPSVEGEDDQLDEQQAVSHGRAQNVHEEREVPLAEVSDQVTVLKDLKQRHQKYVGESTGHRRARPYADQAKTELHGTAHGAHRAHRWLIAGMRVTLHRARVNGFRDSMAAARNPTTDQHRLTWSPFSVYIADAVESGGGHGEIHAKWIYLTLPIAQLDPSIFHWNFNTLRPLRNWRNVAASRCHRLSDETTDHSRINSRWQTVVETHFAEVSPRCGWLMWLTRRSRRNCKILRIRGRATPTSTVIGQWGLPDRVFPWYFFFILQVASKKCGPIIAIRKRRKILPGTTAMCTLVSARRSRRRPLFALKMQRERIARCAWVHNFIRGTVKDPTRRRET